ncbi:hypothetical protein BGZ74_004830 [Mortierella antarctica]|nr:hypothetical protein BGZ74_004830 [Mortierella antarctica]
MEDICSVVRGGILSNIRFKPERHHAFITFVDPTVAIKFVDENSKDMYIKIRKSKVGWTNSAHVLLNEVILALSKGAIRNAQAVEDLQDNPDYVSARVGFGKDRCAQPARPWTSKLSVKGCEKDKAKKLKHWRSDQN